MSKLTEIRKKIQEEIDQEMSDYRKWAKDNNFCIHCQIMTKGCCTCGNHSHPEVLKARQKEMKLYKELNKKYFVK